MQTVKDIVQEQLAIASVDVLVGNKVGGSWAEQGRACGQATHDPATRAIAGTILERLGRS